MSPVNEIDPSPESVFVVGKAIPSFAVIRPLDVIVPVPVVVMFPDVEMSPVNEIDPSPESVFVVGKAIPSFAVIRPADVNDPWFVVVFPVVPKVRVPGSAVLVKLLPTVICMSFVAPVPIFIAPCVPEPLSRLPVQILKFPVV